MPEMPEKSADKAKVTAPIRRPVLFWSLAAISFGFLALAVVEPLWRGL